MTMYSNHMTRNYYRRDIPRAPRTPKLVKWVAAGIIVGIVLAVAIPVAFGYFDKSTVTAVVQDKERVCDSNSDGRTDCKYLVFTDAGTFRISDALIGTVRFNSSDVYGRVKRCHSYDITSYGWRLPFFSSYPNVTDITDLGPADGCEV